jgi:hypothetical protein
MTLIGFTVLKRAEIFLQYLFHFTGFNFRIIKDSGSQINFYRRRLRIIAHRIYLWLKLESGRLNSCHTKNSWF